MNITVTPSDPTDVPKQANLNGSQASHDPPAWALIHTATLSICSLLLVFIFCLGSYGNLVVFLSFFDPAFRKFRTNFDFMILNLSFCDLFMCCVTAPMFALVLYLDAGGGDGVSKSFCFAFHLTSCGFIIMSLETVAVIALHRLRMVLGQQPNRTASFPCTLALTALLWTSSFTMAALLTMRAYPRRDGPCLPHFGLGGGRARPVLYAYLADFAFCVAVVTVSYLMIAHTLKKNAQVRKCPIMTVAARCTPTPPPLVAPSFEGVQCSTQGPPLYRKLQNVKTHSYANGPTQALVPGAAQGATCCQLVSTVNLATAKDSKAVVTCIVIVFSVLLCCLPMGVCLAQDVLSPESNFAHYQFELCGFVLIFLKSGINPFVYSRNSAGLRRRVLCCMHWASLGLLCCKHKTRLHAMGKGSLEVNRNKSSHHETNSAYVLSPKAQKRLVDQACGPSQSRDCGASPRNARRPRPASTSTPINTRIEPYYSIYNSSPSVGPSSPTSLQPASSQTFAFAKSYVAMHYHTHHDALQDFESTSVQQIPVPSV
uniref:probable G-protein coupled receptor 75 n=1 Tax=Doryrhamphus excisus TaxID=161450 RepID=UPI0025ADA0FC|nr:probable G-protein coupled receptor 75 [Doryrhamphus excisus]XP_057914519.1 probable G-protein coupled receptor 75 [Doryrhamphus excisus]